FGGECHEIGFMLLVFTPCLYANVSDSWMLPNKWKRVWIGAGGIYVEIILASLAAFVWYYSEPGLINDLALNMMFLNLVSTVLVNGNPLLRFDGYYILMDLLEIPNLRQKSSELLKRWFQETCLGLELQDDPFLPQRNQLMFALFTIASGIYRWVVVFSICWFLIKVLEPYGLQALGRMVAAAGFVGLIAQPIIQTYKFCRTPGRLAKVKLPRLMATIAVAAALIGVLGFVPIPHQIHCAFEVQTTEAGVVYAQTTGMLQQVSVRAGDEISAGQVLARLENRDLDLQIQDLRGRLEDAILQYNNAETLSITDDESMRGQKLTLAARVDGLRQQLAKSEEEYRKLIITSHKSGIVLAPPDKPNQDTGDGRLPGWTGSPLKEHNLGALLTPDDVICEVVSPTALEAVLIID
ncbi:MAG: biotin/lipoyl-binding protein, partial [Planctomycetota bacterium]